MPYYKKSTITWFIEWQLTALETRFLLNSGNLEICDILNREPLLCSVAGFVNYSSPHSVVEGVPSMRSVLINASQQLFVKSDSFAISETKDSSLYFTPVRILHVFAQVSK